MQIFRLRVDSSFKATLSYWFSDPKQNQSLEIIFEKKFPDNRFAGRPDYSTISIEFFNRPPELFIRTAELMMLFVEDMMYYRT